MRVPKGVVVVGCLLGASAAARAEGFASAGIGPVVAPMTWHGTGELDGMPLELSTTRPGIALLLRVGATVEVTPTMRVGAGVGAAVSIGGGHMGSVHYLFGGEVDATLRASFRLRADRSLHVGVGPAFANIVGMNDLVAMNSDVNFEQQRGAVMDVGMTWERGDKVDLALGRRSGYLRGEHTTYVPIMLVVAVQAGEP